MQIAPLPHPQERHERLLACALQRGSGQLLARRLVPVPQLQIRKIVGPFVRELLVRRVRRAARFERSLARILQRETARNHQQFRERALRRCLDEHASEARVDRQPRHGATDRRQLICRPARRVQSAASTHRAPLVVPAGRETETPRCRPGRTRASAAPPPRDWCGESPDRCIRVAPENPLRRTGDSTRRARAGRSGPCADRRWRARFVRSAGAAVSSDSCSG